jgi:DHA1 family multidrug resistance protein-like MFS transporter
LNPSLTTEERRPVADDGAHDNLWRRNLYVLWLAETMTILGFSLCYPFLPFYLAELGAESFESRALWTGAMSASSAGFMALAAPFWGMAADRYGRKLMIVRAMLGGAITTGLMGLVVAPWQLLILFILDGALSGTVTAAMTLVASSTPRKHLGYALGLLQTAIFTGASIGPLVGGLLADRMGYRPVFGIGFVLLFGSALLVLAMTRENFVRAPRDTTATGPARRDATLMTILLAGALPASVAMMFALRLAGSAVSPILPLFVETLADAGAPLASLTGLTFGVSGICSAIAGLTLGRMADQIGHRLVLIAAGLAIAVLYFPLALVREPWQLIVCYGLLGLATGGISPSAQAVVADLTPPERRGVIFGVTSAAASAGGFIGPFGGSLLAANADLRLVFLFSGSLMLSFTAWLVRALRAPQQGPSAIAEVSESHTGAP